MAVNTYTPVRLRSKCFLCHGDIVLDVERVDHSVLYDDKLHAQLEEQRINRGRRVYEYKRRVHNEYCT